jgi:hypothetical protein
MDASTKADVYTARKRGLLEYSSKFPAFTGIYKFDLTFEVLGKRITLPLVAIREDW